LPRVALDVRNAWPALAGNLHAAPGSALPRTNVVLPNGMAGICGLAFSRQPIAFRPPETNARLRIRMVWKVRQLWQRPRYLQQSQSAGANRPIGTARPPAPSRIVTNPPTVAPSRNIRQTASMVLAPCEASRSGTNASCSTARNIFPVTVTERYFQRSTCLKLAVCSATPKEIATIGIGSANRCSTSITSARQTISPARQSSGARMKIAADAPARKARIGGT
jgi:hypothetical protein